MVFKPLACCISACCSVSLTGLIGAAPEQVAVYSGLAAGGALWRTGWQQHGMIVGLPWQRHRCGLLAFAHIRLVLRCCRCGLTGGASRFHSEYGGTGCDRRRGGERYIGLDRYWFLLGASKVRDGNKQHYSGKDAAASNIGTCHDEIEIEIEIEIER